VAPPPTIGAAAAAAPATAAAADNVADLMAVDDAPRRGADSGDSGSTTTTTTSGSGDSNDGHGDGTSAFPPADAGDATAVHELVLGPLLGDTLLIPSWADDIPPYPSELFDNVTLLADSVLAVTLVAGDDERPAPTPADATALWAAARWLVEDLRARVTATEAGANDARAALDVWAASRRRRAEAVFRDTPFPLAYLGWRAGSWTPPPGSAAAPFFDPPDGEGGGVSPAVARAAAVAVAPPQVVAVVPDGVPPLPLLHTLLTVLCNAVCFDPWHVLGSLVLIARRWRPWRRRRRRRRRL